MTRQAISLLADPRDTEDFDVSAEEVERAARARLIRRTRTQLGVAQTELVTRFSVPAGTPHDWEQARFSPPDFAMTCVRVIERFPEMVGYSY